MTTATPLARTITSIFATLWQGREPNHLCGLAHGVREKPVRKAHDDLALDPDVRVEDFSEFQNLVNMAGVSKVRKIPGHGSGSR